MATQQKEGSQQAADNQSAATSSPVVWVEEHYKKIKEHAETYPYVWGSYILVYGGLGLWTAYRWRKLRKTEDRVRALQERLRKHRESGSPALTTDKAPPPADKTTK